MKHIDLNFEAPGVISLEHLNEQIALEAGFIGRIANTIMDVVPNLVHAARKSFASTKLDKYDLRFVDVNEVVLKRALGDDTYVNISKLPVNVQPGFQDNLFELVSIQKKHLSHANMMVDRLAAYNQFLAGIISSTENRNSLRDYSGLMKAVDVEREALSKQYNVMFKTNSVQALREYGQVIDSNNQWCSILRILMENIELAKKHKMDTVEKLVKETLALLDAIEERVQSKSFGDMTPECLKSLSAMTLTAAREVEFYATSMYRLAEFKLCYEKSCNTLIKALR